MEIPVKHANNRTYKNSCSEAIGGDPLVLAISFLYHDSLRITWISSWFRRNVFLVPRNIPNILSRVIRTSVDLKTKASIWMSGICEFISFICLTARPAGRSELARRMDARAPTNTIHSPIRSKRFALTSATNTCFVLSGRTYVD